MNNPLTPARTPPPGYPSYPAPPTVIVSESDIDEVSLPLSHYLWILRRHIWKISAFVGAAVIATALISLRLTPVYESTATLYVELRVTRPPNSYLLQVSYRSEPL